MPAAAPPGVAHKLAGAACHDDRSPVSEEWASRDAVRRDPRLDQQLQRRIRAVATTETFADVASVLPVTASTSSAVPQWLVIEILWFAEHLYGVLISRARAIDVVGSLEPGELFVITMKPIQFCPMVQPYAGRDTRAMPLEAWAPDRRPAAPRRESL